MNAALTASETGGPAWQRLVHAGIVEEICRGIITLRSVSQFSPDSIAAVMEDVSSSNLPSPAECRDGTTYDYEHRNIYPHIQHIFRFCAVQVII